MKINIFLKLSVVSLLMACNSGAEHENTEAEVAEVVETVVVDKHSKANVGEVNTKHLHLDLTVDFDASNNNILYATKSGYTAGDKVFKSTDGGVNWVNISGNMPNVIMKKILFRQGSSEQLFVGTELGVYFTTNVDGASTVWEKFGDNLPNVIVNDLKINYVDNKLFIGTYGRGMWSIDISNITLGVENLEANDILAPKLYPNPVSNGQLNIKLTNDSELFNYVIYNVVGGFIQKGKLNLGDNTINIDNVTPGIYIVKLTSNSYVFSQKIIIK